MKHPTLGNKHFDDEQLEVLRAKGWVRWPRTAAEKSAAPVEQEVLSVSPWSAPATGAAPDDSTDDELATVKQRLADLGIKYHANSGLKKLYSLLPKE